jgi:hypothetical protein
MSSWVAASLLILQACQTFNTCKLPDPNSLLRIYSAEASVRKNHKQLQVLRERERERVRHSRMFRVNVLAEQASRFMMEEDMKGG